MGTSQVDQPGVVFERVQAIVAIRPRVEGRGQRRKIAALEDAAMDALRRCFVGSIGPTTTEALEEFGVRPAFEPSHPKMGVLVVEAAQRSSAA